MAAGGISDCCSMPVNQSFQFRDSPEMKVPRSVAQRMTSNVPYVPLSICNIICSLEYLILNINYLISFACSACWPFISTGNEEPALDKSIACTTQASQVSQASQASQASILSYRCALQGYTVVGALVTCSKRTMAGRVTSTAQNELQIIFDIFDEKAFNYIQSFHANKLLSVRTRKFLQTCSRIPSFALLPFAPSKVSSLSLFLQSLPVFSEPAHQKTKKINSCSVQHIHIWGQKQS